MKGSRTRRVTPRRSLSFAIDRAVHARVRAALEPLEGRTLLAAGDPIISEFMADNTTGLADGNGVRGDWIEIYNPGATAINMQGWHLTDTPSNPGLYTFPSFTIPAGGYRVVFATSETTPYVDSAGYPHTNFALSKGGEYLALSKPDGTVTSDYAPQFPPQSTNVSYGVGPGGASQTALLNSGTAGKSLTPTGPIGTAWTGQDFSDAGWTSIATGIGFEANGLSIPAITQETEGNNDRASANNATTSFTPYSGNLYQLGFTGSIGSATDTDYVKIGTFQVGDVITVTASGVGGTPLGDPVIDLYRGANAATLVTSDDNNGPGNDALIQRFSVTAADTYYLRVRANASGTGNYRVGVRLENAGAAPGTGSTLTSEVESNNTGATATDLSNAWRAVNYQHSLGGGTNFGSSEDWFKYQFNAGDVVTAYLTAGSGSTADATVSIRDANGNVLVVENGSSTPGGANDLNSYLYAYVIPSTGVYYVQTVRATGTTGTGPYTLDVYLSTTTAPPHPAVLTGQYFSSVQADAYNKNASTYLRVPFNAPDPSTVSALTLKMKYEDGFVAYLNGVEVARRNAPGTAGTPLAFNAAASSDRAAALATAFESIDISAFKSALVVGTNVLAIQGLNSSVESDDFLIAPEITAQVTSTGTKQFFFSPTPGQANLPGAGVVINEIHYDPDVKTERVDFVELVNNSSGSINIGNWQLGKGVTFTFPAGTTLAAGQYIVVTENAAQFQTKFGKSAFGQYVGNLSGDGDQVRLTDALGNTIDNVSYGAGFPWPTVGDPLTTPGTGASIQLINPGFDNDLGGNWRSALPTPGAQNAVFAGNAPPAIRQVDNSPTQPTAGQPVTVTAKVTDPDGVGSVTLQYQVNAPGNYIPYQIVNASFGISANPAYAQNWVTLTMYDDGTHGDAKPFDGIYAAQIPGGVNQNRTLIRYKISAADALGATVTGPYADDPQLNFAYYVYNGVPGWTGAVQPGSTPATTFGPSVMSSAPVYTFLTTKQDHANALHVPVGTVNPQQASGYGGEEYLWAGTLIYNGKVYDNVRWRARGGVWRYAMGKNMWKIDFNRNHYFEYVDAFGNAYPTPWKKLNLSAVIQQGNFGQRGEQGLFEYSGFKLFNMSGAPGPVSSPIGLRIVEDGSETGPTSSQYDDDFQGLYLAIEQQDGQLLEAHDMPDGNLYKMETGPGGGLSNNQGPTQPSDNSDLVSFTNTYKGGPQTEQWWRDHVDLDAYFAYRIVVDAMHHYDTGFGKNYFFYHNPVTDKWQIMPWDLDLTWTTTYQEPPSGGDQDPFRAAGILNIPNIQRDYKNYVREFRDLLWTPEQMGQLFDEYARMVDNPSGVSLVEADRRMWDYNPIMFSPYVNSGKAGAFRFYAGSPTGTFAGMVQKLKDYVVTRTALIDNTAADANVPNKPTVSYTGPAGQPVDQLSFGTTGYSSPAGSAFAAMKWRIAEVYDSSNPTYANWQGERPYEIKANWESAELTTFNGTLTGIPANRLIPGRTYRVRVKMKDAAGRWSKWSDPIQFVAGAAGASVTALRITEMMYHPAAPPAGSPYTRDDFEYLELLNTSDGNLDLSGVRFANGIDFTFPDGFVLAPGQRTLVVSNLAAFRSRYGAGLDSLVAGEFANGTHLSDSGERLRLEGPVGQTILDFSYSENWYPQTDGDGFSLVIINPAADPTSWGDKASWRVGQNVNGAPGAADPGLNPDSIVVNEILANPGVDRSFIEIRNTTNSAIDLSNWFLSDRSDDPRKFKFAAGTVLQSGDLLTLYADASFGIGAKPFNLSSLGGTLYLTSADGSGAILGYREEQDYGASDVGVTLGRYVTSDGDADFTAMALATPGGANGVPRVGPIVITEVMYNPPAGGNEFVELRNTSNAAVDISGWQMAGLTFTFPAGTVIPAHGYFLVVPILPSDFRTAYNVPPATQVFGPYAGLLDDAGEAVEIRKPGTPVGGVTPYVTIDRVRYHATFPWPTAPDGAGPALQRRSQSAYGNDVANWVASAGSGGSPGRPNAPTTASAVYDPATSRGKISVTFSEDVSASLTGATLTLQNLSGGATPSTNYAWNPATLTATWTFAQIPANGNYRATLDGAALTDWVGTPVDGDGDGQTGGSLALDFFVLAGDANHDRVVNFDDLLILAKNYNKVGVTYAEGDFNYDGLVNFDDLLILAKAYNNVLAAPGAPAPAQSVAAPAPLASLFSVATDGSQTTSTTTKTTSAPSPKPAPPPPAPVKSKPIPVPPPKPIVTKKPAPKPPALPPVPVKPKTPVKATTFSKARIH